MITATEEELGLTAIQKKNRGLTVLTPQQLIKISGIKKDGNRMSVNLGEQWLQVDPVTAIEIYRRCPPVFAVVSGRALKISALEWTVKPMSTDEDRIAHMLREWKEIYQESDAGPISAGMRFGLLRKINNYLFNVKPDMSNFEKSLLRWKSRITSKRNDKSQEIINFLSEPMPGQPFSSFLREYVLDAGIHGRTATYKLPGPDGFGLSGFRLLPGGTVYPVRGSHAAVPEIYVQIPFGIRYGSFEPQVMFGDEISFSRYLPSSSVAAGMTPIDALLTLVTESLLFNELMAEQSDGSKAPDKLLIMGKKIEGFDPSGISETDEPLDPDEQRRVKHVLNRKKKDNAVEILSYYGTPFLADLTKENTMGVQMTRQDKIDKYVAMVYGATNNEINQTDSSGTSGRSTSETQERSENARGVRPMIVQIQDDMTFGVIRDAFGPGYQLIFATPKSDAEQIDNAKKKVESGLFAINEVRRDDLSKPPFEDPEHDKPRAAQPPQEERTAEAVMRAMEWEDHLGKKL